MSNVSILQIISSLVLRSVNQVEDWPTKSGGGWAWPVPGPHDGYYGVAWKQMGKIESRSARNQGDDVMAPTGWFRIQRAPFF